MMISQSRGILSRRHKFSVGHAYTGIYGDVSFSYSTVKNAGKMFPFGTRMP